MKLTPPLSVSLTFPFYLSSISFFLSIFVSLCFLLLCVYLFSSLFFPLSLFLHVFLSAIPACLSVCLSILCMCVNVFVLLYFLSDFSSCVFLSSILLLVSLPYFCLSPFFKILFVSFLSDVAFVCFFPHPILNNCLSLTLLSVCISLVQSHRVLNTTRFVKW